MSAESFGNFGFSQSVPSEFDPHEADKNRLLARLAELQQFISQEEDVLEQATAAQDQLESRVEGLRHAVEHAESELHERGDLLTADEKRQQEEDEERRLISLRCHGRKSVDDHDEHIPEEMLSELAELSVELEQLQDRHESLQHALRQATEALENANVSDSPLKPAAGGCRNAAAQAEVQELELELERMSRREAKLVEEQKSRVSQLQEEINYVEAHSRDERWALKEDILHATAEGEVVEAEIEGVKVGTTRALNKLQKEEEMLRMEVERAHGRAETISAHRGSQMKELKRKCQTLREVAQEARRLSDPAVKANKRLTAKTLQINGHHSPRPSKGNQLMDVIEEDRPQGSPANSPRGSMAFGSSPSLLSPSFGFGGSRKKTLFDELHGGDDDDDVNSSANDLFHELHGASPSASPRGEVTKPQKDRKLSSKNTLSLDAISETLCAAPSISVLPPNSTPPRASRLPPAQQGPQGDTEDGHEDSMTIKVDRTSGTSLGIGVDQELIITAIEDEGLIAAWNGTHSLSSICAGYQIVEVNGRLDLKKMIKHLKARRPVEIKLKWKGLNKKSTLIRARASTLRKERCSTLGTYNCNGVMRINLDDNDDASSVASSGSRRSTRSIGNEATQSKLSVIGEDSTIAGSSNSSSSNSNSSAETGRRNFSIADPEERLSPGTLLNRDTLEANYDALDRFGRASTKEPEICRMDSGASDEDVSGAVKPRRSIEQCYEHLDVQLPPSTAGPGIAAPDVLETITAAAGEKLEVARPLLDSSTALQLSPLDRLETSDNSPATGNVLDDSLMSELRPDADVESIVANISNGDGPLISEPVAVPESDSILELKVGDGDKVKTVTVPPGCRGMLEWSLRESNASPDDIVHWSKPRFFEAAMDEQRRYLLRSQRQEMPVTPTLKATEAGELEIALLAVTAVRLDRRDPEERIFSVRHRAASGERVECLFRAPDPTACTEWTRGLMALITDLRRSGADVKMVPRLTATVAAVKAMNRLSPLKALKGFSPLSRS